MAGLSFWNVGNMDEKRDSKALGVALVTVPITIISAIGVASTIPIEEADNKEVDPKDPGQSADGDTLPASNASGANAVSPSAAISTANQLTYTVRAGDTVTGIARKFQMSTRQLLQLNEIARNSLLVPGQKLKLISDVVAPPSVEKAAAATVHVVKRGETIASIAKQHGISISTVLSMNALSAKAIIFPGQRLTIGSVIPKKPASVLPAEHTVAAGETLASIANLYGLKLSNLLEANSFTESSLIYFGQKIQLQPNRLAAKAPAGKSKPTAAPLSGALSSTDPRRPSNVCEIHGFHTVRSGETISRIAAAHGVSTQAILSSNNLTWSTMIFIGQKLVIPGVHEIKFCPEITQMTKEMRSNAQVIYRIGKSLGVSDYGIVIALATAMQESGIRNINYGDRDSVGIFQQRPSAHWGTVAEIMNPEYSARAFFGGPKSPTAGAAKGLLDIKDWSTKTLTQAAQAVQISAFPNAYAKWELSAWVWLDQLSEDNGSGTGA
jgi:LysM repeat protein